MRGPPLPLFLFLSWGCGHAAATGPGDGGGASARESPPPTQRAVAGSSDAAADAGACPPDDGAAELRAAGLHLPVDDGLWEVRLRAYVRLDGSLDCLVLFSTENEGLTADCFALAEENRWRPRRDAQGNPTEAWITYLCTFEPRATDAGAAPEVGVAGDDGGT